MTIEKKLLVWDGKGIPREDKKIYAEDYFCVRCYEKREKNPAEVFYGLNDPDASRPPYCKSCTNELEMEYWLEVMNNPLK